MGPFLSPYHWQLAPVWSQRLVAAPGRDAETQFGTLGPWIYVHPSDGFPTIKSDSTIPNLTSESQGPSWLLLVLSPAQYKIGKSAFVILKRRPKRHRKTIYATLGCMSRQRTPKPVPGLFCVGSFGFSGKSPKLNN